MKSNKLNIFVCLSSAILVIGYVFFSSEFDTLIHHINTLKYRWIAAAVGCMVVYWLLESAALHVMIKPMYGKQRFADTVRVSMGGQYFNNITPFATGGQPFQAYAMAKQGMPLGVAINSLLSKFIVYQLALVLVSTLLLIFRLGYFQENVPGFTAYVIIGYAIEVGVMLGVLSIAVFHNAVKKVSHWIIRVLYKMHFVKDPDGRTAYIDDELEKFQECFKVMIKDLPTMAVAFCFSVLQLLVFMAIPFAIYKAFSLQGIDLITILAAQSFVMMVSSFIPIPGASVGAESFFYFFFDKFFGDGVGLAMILWRTITFYLTLIVGAVFAVRIQKSPSKQVVQKDEAPASPPEEPTAQQE